MERFQDKNILIVGASSGVGLALAENLLNKGANVYTASRRAPSLNGTTHISFDVLNDEITNLTSILPDQLHGIAYCPGSITLKPFSRLAEKDFISDYQINVIGAVKIFQACFSKLRKAKGASLILFSTVASTVGMSYHASIAAAKGAVEGLGKSLAAEFASSKIRVNIIAPSLTNTPLAKQLLATEEKREASAKRHPLGRVGESEDLANISAFLLSDDSSWMTGQVIGVDGGMSTLKPL